MTKRLSKLKVETCYHGHAGLASAFAALAHRKLKPGGILALVLPLTAASSSSWLAFRKLISRSYNEITILSIAANGREMSFSSDTGISEFLMIARKTLDGAGGPSVPPRERGQFISLSQRPQGFAHAGAIARSIARCDSPRQIEDGPYGGTRLMVGGEVVGEVLTAPLFETGENWGGVRLLDNSVAQIAYALSCSKLWLPSTQFPIGLRVVPLEDMGSLGLYNLDIIGKPPQGPFDKVSPSPTASYPSLWNHNAKSETRLICAPDSQLQVRQGMEGKAAHVWAIAGRAHLNQEFTFGSQALVVSQLWNQKGKGGEVWIGRLGF